MNSAAIGFASVIVGALAAFLVPLRAPEPAPAITSGEPALEAPSLPHTTPGLRASPAEEPETAEALRREIELLRENPLTWTGGEIERRIAILLAKKSALMKKGDRWGLFALARDLALLGADGCPHAWDILADLAGPLDAPIDANLDASDGPLVDLMKWGLARPRLDARMRQFAVHALARNAGDDPDMAAFFAERLAVEEDPTVANLLAAAIPRTQRSPVVPDLRPLLPASKSIEPEGVLEYFRGVRTAPWTAEEKERVLTELTAHANPAIASSAAATRVFLSPQATGILVEWVSPDSVAAQYGVLSGDIVLSVNDQPAFDTAEMNRELNSTPKGQHARIRIFRNGQESVLSWVVTRSDSGLVGAWVEKP